MHALATNSRACSDVDVVGHGVVVHVVVGMCIIPVGIPSQHCVGGNEPKSFLDEIQRCTY